ncbi:F0F1 ATP synthase subunit A [Mycoplasma sp. 394]
MDEIKQRLWKFDLPQLFSLIVTVIIIAIFSLIIFFKVRKQRADQAPKGITQLAEGYLGYIDNSYQETVGDQLPGSRFYIFTLATFLLVGNWVSIIGLEPIGTAFSVPITLAVATWLGIILSGTIYRRWRYYWSIIKAPWDIFGKFSPLISLSARMYGNLVGGSTIIVLIYAMFGYLFKVALGTDNSAFQNIFAIYFTPLLHMYFDLFDGILQALIFTMLTAVYWTIESQSTEPAKKTKNSESRFFKKFTKRKIQSIY